MSATTPLYHSLARAARRLHSLAIFQDRLSAGRLTPEASLEFIAKAKVNRDKSWEYLTMARDAKAKAMVRAA